MIPNNSLAFPARISSFKSPKNLPTSPILDYSIGGVGISDPSKGLNYQTWTGTVINPGISTSYIQISSPNTPATTILSSPTITWMRLSFDQNMHPFLSFVDQNGPAYYWFDPTIPGNIIVRMAATVQTPNCVMDDTNAFATRLNTNDIILSYLNNNNLCYRQLRDRFSTEYVLLVNVPSLVVAPSLTKTGMNLLNRLQFEIDGALYA